MPGLKAELKDFHLSPYAAPNFPHEQVMLCSLGVFNFKPLLGEKTQTQAIPRVPLYLGTYKLKGVKTMVLCRVAKDDHGLFRLASSNLP